MQTKKLVVGALAATALTLGGGGAAVAAQQAPGTTANETKQEQQEPSYKGSIKAPADKNKEGKENESAESKKLQSLAKIDRKAAERAATRAVSGTVKKAELGNENGYVVWDVEVIGQNGKTTDVKVDAGNAKILAKESADHEDSGKGETKDGSEANEGQGGGATNNR